MDILSSLRLAELERLDLHERHETARLSRTCEAIREEGVLRHPLLAVETGEGRLLVLDGAHRMSALKRLGCRRAPVQVVRPADLILETWDHMIPEGPWLDRLREDPCFRFVGGSAARDWLAELTDGEGRTAFILPEGIPESGGRLRAWHRLVETYSGKYPVRRFPRGSRKRPEKGSVILRYPRLTLEELVATVQRGEVMPAGVTRFIVDGRLLNLRIPLHLLTAERVDFGEWERLLQDRSFHLRLYTESVYLCEV